MRTSNNLARVLSTATVPEGGERFLRKLEIKVGRVPCGELTLLCDGTSDAPRAARSGPFC
jgi:hypothetical protein